MSNKLNRRHFLLASVSAAAIPFMFTKNPKPQIYKLSQWRFYKNLKALERAFIYLETEKLESKAPQRYAIDGDRMYATVVEDKTRSIDTALFEEHRKYIDVHYLVRGNEMIGSAELANLVISKPYSADVEAALYEKPKKYDRLILSPGDFTVFFPGQAHMPGCFVDKSEGIRKVVVKILAESVNIK